MSVSLWLWGYSRPGQAVLAGFQINTAGSETVNRVIVSLEKKPATLNSFYEIFFIFNTWNFEARDMECSVKVKAVSAELNNYQRIAVQKGIGSKLGLTNGVEAIDILWTQTKVIARLMVSLWAKKWLF